MSETPPNVARALAAYASLIDDQASLVEQREASSIIHRELVVMTPKDKDLYYLSAAAMRRMKGERDANAHEDGSTGG